jgi:hypothetical protein
MNPRHLTVLIVLLLLALLALAGCPANNTPQRIPPSPPPATGYEPPATPTNPTNPGAAAGASCTTAADCASGICEGEGCGDARGFCAEASRACTKDLRPYCGCDGVTFGASGTCPGRRFAHTGSCDTATQTPPPPPPPPTPTCPGSPTCAAQPDGSPCLDNTHCSSGVCEGIGCGIDAPGKCVPKTRRCTRDRRAYCGCDGKTFFASGTCPGKRHRAREMCPDGQ